MSAGGLVAVPGRVRGFPAAIDAVAVAALLFGVSVLGTAVAADRGLDAHIARGTLQMGTALILVLAVRRALTAPARDRALFWRLVAAGSALLGACYLTSALAEWGLGTVWAGVSLAALLAAYPWFVAALAVRAVREEGFQGGLATFLDVAIVVTALLAACVPTLVGPLLDQGTTEAWTAGITWVANVGLFVGGLAVLYRLPEGRRLAGVGLLTAGAGVFSAVSLAEVGIQLNGGTLPWWIAVGPGVGMLMLAAAPGCDTPAPAGRRLHEPAALRAAMPSAALLLLGGLWVLALVGGWSTRVLGSGMALVALLTTARQILLLRDHQEVIAGERRRVGELRLLQDAARVLSSTLDLDAVLAQVVAATSSLLTATGRRRCVATVLRRDGDHLVSVAVRDEDGRADFGGACYPLNEFPLLADAVGGGLLRHGRLDDLNLAGGVRAVVKRSGVRAYAIAPLHVGGDVWGLLTVSAREIDEFSAVELERLGGIVGIADLAITNALSYARLRDSAATDPVTGVRNRREFERVLGELPRAPFAVLAIDVDGLKSINDEHGHEAGDVVLRAVASTLGQMIRGGDVFARLGGDEFAALLHGADSTDAHAVAERMQRTLRGVSVPRGRARVSIGYAAGPAGADAHAVWRSADEALLAAKRAGRDCVAGATTVPLPSVRTARPTWPEVLGRILETRAVDVVYQAIARLDDGEVVGFEALARPEGGATDAGVDGLFAAAQHHGCLRDLDWLCRRAAMARAHVLPPRVPVFVNVSSASLLDPVHGVDQMLLLCRWAGRDPRETVLEITERETISDLGRMRAVLAAYREHGFRFAVDDVGEGHSTLEVLVAAMPEYVKIARALVADPIHPGHAAAIRATVAFVRSTGAEVIAEGVETASQAAALSALGVDMVQGWLVGRPEREPSARRRPVRLLERYAAG